MVTPEVTLQVWNRLRGWLRFAGELYGPEGLKQYGLDNTLAEARLFVENTHLRCTTIDLPGRHHLRLNKFTNFRASTLHRGLCNNCLLVAVLWFYGKGDSSADPILAEPCASLSPCARLMSDVALSSGFQAGTLHEQIQS